MKYFLLIFTGLLFVQSCHTVTEQESTETGSGVVRYVDPFIGTGAHGHTYPGATVPFGQVQLSPDNGAQGWDWSSGYHYSDSVISGFSHTHLSGTGIGDLCDISVMPVAGRVDLAAATGGNTGRPGYASLFSHDRETATPGYYSVVLKDYTILAELTATPHVGFHKYTFNKPGSAAIIFNLGFAINWDQPVETYIRVENDSSITGYRLSRGWAEDQRVYFAAEFSRPFAGYALAGSGRLQDKAAEVRGKQVSARFDFAFPAGEAVLLKVGLSSASIEGAKAAIREEVPHWNFEQVKDEAAAAWNDHLNKVTVKSGDEQLKKIFYTALYHTKLAPVIFSDRNGEYKGPDSLEHTATGNRYTVFSLWDTFRAAHPLFTLLEGDRVNDMINSMLSHYRQYGLLPVWELYGNETNTMTGYHAIPVIVDAYFKGYRAYDVEEAYQALKKSAMQDIRGVNFYKEYGFIPSDLENESVTKNLEYAFDDWCIAQMAKDLGKQEDYQYFIKRAHSYKHLFDPETGFMRGKNTDGSWNTPFDPKLSSHRVNTDYTEGNAWQHSWFVPHDIQGLINLHGGNKPFIQKLDEMFKEDSRITGKNVSPDISGLIGQYAHGNEPGHHIPYLYAYAGAPWKTQRMVRQIMDSLYMATPEGIPGNEDCGQMSAWYVFSAMGFYPVNPAGGIYVLGSPLFEEVTIEAGKGKPFTVNAENVSPENKYIQSATLNGKPLGRSYIYHKEIMKGGELRLVMGSRPNKSWGSQAKTFPPSMSARSIN